MILRETFSNYLINKEKFNINNKYKKYINNLSTELSDIPNLILYGPSGIGKYSESLNIISKYSNSDLKYEKKMIIENSKSNHIIKISDIHYEIDMENLTCNSKNLFNDIYSNIIDAIQSSNYKKGIILCKNFHLISNEILENFYNYMQKNLFEKYIIKFILLTEQISFIPKNILDISIILYYSKLSNSNYYKLSNKINKKILFNQDDNQDNNDNNEDDNNEDDNKYIINKVNNINNLKNLDFSSKEYNIMYDFKNKICDKLIEFIFLDIKQINYNNIRNSIYDLLIYNINVTNSMQYIIFNTIKILLTEKPNRENNDLINKIFIKTCIFLKYYNNNYRPIYHLESIILYLIKLVNEY